VFYFRITIAVIVYFLLIGINILFEGLNPNYFDKIIPIKPINNIREVNLTLSFVSPCSCLGLFDLSIYFGE
jgi:hypothetical protein